AFRLGQTRDGVEPFDNVFGRNRHATDADPLTEVDEMRRGVETRDEAGLAPQALEIARSRALAVRARDVSRGEVALGTAEGLEQHKNAREAELSPSALEAEQALECGLIEGKRRGHRSAGRAMETRGVSCTGVSPSEAGGLAPRVNPLVP